MKKKREIILLHFKDNKSQREISEITGISRAQQSSFYLSSPSILPYIPIIATAFPLQFREYTSFTLNFA